MAEIVRLVVTDFQCNIRKLHVCGGEQFLGPIDPQGSQIADESTSLMLGKDSAEMSGAHPDMAGNRQKGNVGVIKMFSGIGFGSSDNMPVFVCFGFQGFGR